MVTTFYPPYHFGGDAVYVYRLSNKLAELGHEVDVIHCRDAFNILSGQPGTPLPNHKNIRIHTLGSRAKSQSPLLTQQTGRMVLKKKRIERILEQGNFDVIHYHNVSLVGGLDVLAVGHGVKLFTVHEFWLVCPTHILFKNASHVCKNPECFRCQLIYRRPPQFWRNKSFVRKMLNHIDRFLVASEFAVDMHRERGVELNAEILPLFTAWPEAETARDDLLPLGLVDYFLFVGRLEKLKGLQDVIPLFVDAPELNLVIAGTGAYEPLLRQLAATSANIHFLGMLPMTDLKNLYRGALATIIPSLCYEISPQVLGESWSCGTPIIARKIGALEEPCRETHRAGAAASRHWNRVDAVETGFVPGDTVARRWGPLYPSPCDEIRVGRESRRCSSRTRLY